MSCTRRRIDVETHQPVFRWVLTRLAVAGPVSGKTIGIDATTLETKAALLSKVHRDPGESYETFLHGLAAASGIPTPTRAEVGGLDRNRPTKGSNDDWTHPHDSDAKITTLRNGCTHLAHKAEKVMDLEAGAVVGVSVQDAAAGHAETMVETLLTAAEQLNTILPARANLSEVVGDDAYNSNQTPVTLADIGLRCYISVPARAGGRRQRHHEARDPAYANRRRIRRARGPQLLRRRGERLDRSHVHLYETDRLRRVHLRGHANVLKRLNVHVCGLNLDLLMPRLAGVGTPRRPQPRPHLHRRPDPHTAPLLAAPVTLKGGGDFAFARSAVRRSLDSALSKRVARARNGRFRHRRLGLIDRCVRLPPDVANGDVRTEPITMIVRPRCPNLASYDPV